MLNGPAEVPYPTSSSSISSISSKTSSIRTVAANGNVSGTVDAVTGPIVNAGRLAFRALGIGSLLSVGGVGLLTAGESKAQQ